MSAEIVYLDSVRPGRSVPVMSRSEVMISAAADVSQLDYLKTAAELAMRHIEATGQPLPPQNRALVMRAVALLRGQPE